MGPGTGGSLAADQMTSDEGTGPADSQTSGDGGDGLVADQTTNQEEAV